MVRERLLTFHKSASNITHAAIASQERSACVLHTVQHALTAYSLGRPPVQCSMLCMLLCASATVQKFQCGCELAGGGEALPDLVHYIYYHGIVQSCSTVSVTLCILHFAGGFPHTLRSTFWSQHWARFY